jgi:hypothetical protein
MKEERDSLLTTLRLLMKDFKSSEENHINFNEASKPKQNGGSSTEGEALNSKAKIASHERNSSTKSQSPTHMNTSEGNNDVRSGREVEKIIKVHSVHTSGTGRTGGDVFVVGDSMIKYVQGRRLSKKHKVTTITCPGATVADMGDFVKPVIRKKPKKIIHVGTNNLRHDKPKQLSRKIVDLAYNIKKEQPTVDIAISSIIHRSDNISQNQSSE